MHALRERYRPRFIRFMDLWTIGEWRLKVYQITRYPGDLPAALHDAAIHLVPSCLPAVSPDCYGVGFVGVHAGRGASVVFVCWWSHENELHHRLYLSAPHDPVSMRPAADSDMTACVWDLALMAFEREAWIRSVLAADVPSLDHYLSLRMNLII
jgi:hypothetical protein